MGRIRWARMKGNQLGLKHGHKRAGYESPTYTSWRGMRDRCRRHPLYKGINWDPRWDKFENFLEDMGERPEGHDLDRWPNQDGDYGPNNCKWTPLSENRSRAAARRKKRG